MFQRRVPEMKNSSYADWDSRLRRARRFGFHTSVINPGCYRPRIRIVGKTVRLSVPQDQWAGLMISRCLLNGDGARPRKLLASRGYPRRDRINPTRIAQQLAACVPPWVSRDLYRLLWKCKNLGEIQRI
jgi:hypothetical protein